MLVQPYDTQSPCSVINLMILDTYKTMTNSA